MIDQTHIALTGARDRLVARVMELQRELDAGRDDLWPLYAQMVATLTAVDGHLRQQRGEHVLTSAELGEKFGLSPKTAIRKAKNGQLPVQAIPIGPRGRGTAVRWKTQ